MKYGKYAKWQIKRRQRQIEELSQSLKSAYAGVISVPSTLTVFSADKKGEILSTYLRQIIYTEQYYSWAPFI